MTSSADAGRETDDLTHYMLATARMRERAEQAEAELERLRQREAALRGAMAEWTRRHSELGRHCTACEVIRWEGAALAQAEQTTAQPQPTQQQVRAAMADAYASDNPGSPRQRAVHVPLDNGA